jgi:hypothetical protein
VEKARDSLRSYSTEVLGPRVGFPLRSGANEDLSGPCAVPDTLVKIPVLDGLHLSKVLKSTTNMFSSIVYSHRKLQL